MGVSVLALLMFLVIVSLLFQCLPYPYCTSAALVWLGLPRERGGQGMGIMIVFAYKSFIAALFLVQFCNVLEFLKCL